MLLKQLLLAASAAAFLVIPDVTEEEENMYKVLPIDVTYEHELPAHAMAQSVGVPCKQCKGKNSHLQMDFEIQDNQSLMLNGYELYPNADPWHSDLIASVVKENGKEKKQRLGYSLAVMPEGLDEEEHLEVIGIELRVIEVGRRFIEGIPAVKVKLVKAPSGDILIGSVDMLEASQTECTTILCRAKHVIAEAWKGIKTCGQNGYGLSSDDRVVVESGNKHEHDDTHSHEWGKLIKNIAAHIFLPVLMGIMAGFGVAVFVMLLCGIAVRLTRLVRGGERRCRRHRRNSRRSKPTVNEIAVEEEKVGLVLEQETPAPYRDEE